MQLIQQMMQGNNQMMQNPMLQNAMQMAKTNDVKGLQSLAENICKSRGVSVESMQNEVAKRFMNR